MLSCWVCLPVRQGRWTPSSDCFCRQVGAGCRRPGAVAGEWGQAWGCCRNSAMLGQGLDVGGEAAAGAGVCGGDTEGRAVRGRACVVVWAVGSRSVEGKWEAGLWGVGL